LGKHLDCVCAHMVKWILHRKGEQTMKTYYYNLDTEQAKYFAGLEKGESMVFFVPVEQPPEGYIDDDVFTDGINGYTYLGMTADQDYPIFELPYPLNARVGLRERWKYCFINNGVIQYNSNSCVGCKYFQCASQFKWQSSQCMPHDAILYWPHVTGIRVCEVQSITEKEASLTGVGKRILDDLGQKWETYKCGLEYWFNHRYAHTAVKHTWESNPWGEVIAVEKE